MELDEAKTAVEAPATTGADLQSIAVEHHELWARIAAHPNAYPGLLSWLDQYGDESVKEAVATRQAADAAPAMATMLAMPMPAPPKPAPKPGASRKLVTGILIGVVVVALVVAGVLFLPKLITGGGGTSSPGANSTGTPGGGTTTGSAGLQVTGDAPVAGTRQPTFLDGYRTLTTIQSYSWFAGVGSNKLVFGQQISQADDQFAAIDTTTGETSWVSDQFCQFLIADIAVLCFESDGRGQNSGTYSWVDINTGQSQGTLDTTALGPNILDSDTVSDGVLLVGSQSDVLTNSNGDGTDSATVGYYTGPGKPQWTASVQFGMLDVDSPSETEESDGLIAWYTYGNEYVLDQATGYVVHQTSGGFAQIFADRVVYLEDFMGKGSGADQQVNVPGGRPVTIRWAGDNNTYMVDFTKSYHPNVVLVTSGSVMTAYDPSDGHQLWQDSTSDWPDIDSIAWDGARTGFLLGAHGQVWAFDVNTGDIIWRSSIPGYTETQGQSIAVSGSLVVASGYVDENDDFSAASAFFRADNGQPLTSFKSFTRSSADLFDGVLAINSNSNAQILVPAFSDQVQAMMAAPADMPSCPAGMSVVSWTKYDTGSVLVCSGGGSYGVVLSDPDLTVTQLLFDPAGTLITCDDGTTIRLGAGGSVVIIDASGQMTAHAASEAWTPGDGQVNYPSASSNILACPANTWPISLSTWNGGWLLVCGTDTATATWLGFSDGTSSGSSTNVTDTGVSYCADLDVGQVCSYAAPALVTLTPTTGDQLQYPVDNNYFPGSGAGGAGLGTGAYGVDVPTSDTAEEQARYLEQVLQASARARSDLRSVMTHLNNKIATNQDIATLQSVVDARNQQIAAIDGAPVTELPDGANLVAKLRQALEVSEQTDELYVQWAQYIQIGDWANADATVAQWRPPAHQSDVLKQAFCDQWNRDIAPAYGVSTFQASQI